MKRIVSGTLATLMMLTWLLTTSQVARADDFTCDDSVLDEKPMTVDNVLVPQGATCMLDGTTVLGSIKVEAGATLNATNVTVNGSIQADGAEAVNVSSAPTETCSVGGSIQVKNGGGAVIVGVYVCGDVQLEGNDLSLSVEDNMVGGNMQVFKNIKDPEQEYVTITILNNEIGGNLQCKENEPDPSGSGNMVTGNAEDECAGLIDSGTADAGATDGQTSEAGALGAGRLIYLPALPH
jgi:hypothetical protein